MEKLAWRVSEFGEAIGVSRAKAYEVLAEHPELAVKIGGSKRVLIERARVWLEKQASEGETARA